jgi:transcription antitermination protein NusB
MALTPHKLREIVFHLLYCTDFAPDQLDEVFPFLMQHHKVTKKSIFAAQKQVQEIQSRLPEIDRMIAETSKEYELNRIPRVERNLLRLGAYEICYSDVPPKVAINEAVRLTKKFATDESGNFINAILDAIFKKKSESL